jgi:hypothetical protein
MPGVARSLGADVALVHEIDTSPGYGADTGISPKELIHQAKQDGKRLLEGFRQRLSLQPSALEFVVAGMPAVGVMRHAFCPVLVIRAKE